jgi:uncharacterized protein (TIGR00288 family)
MGMPYTRAPHAEGTPGPSSSGPHAPNAALLIDFDNVTMGMRSDLSKELKSLLNSDVIKGKVAVQRAYADWRRYPQYIVPLSENSVDLIFAPAYGSSKKNATDIRMAIDALELVFIRPEIGVFILLTGDSDFSSLVLKLKEYGKYVIGVGIQESTSDILVQNCDEYYSYTSLAGLRKTSDHGASAALDPWVLIDKAVKQMEGRRDVMRSDRLKQVMIEMDPLFDEGAFGFSKFSKFLSEAAGRGLVRLRKLDNGQYEVGSVGGGDAAEAEAEVKESRESSRGKDRSRGRRGREGGEDREEKPRAEKGRGRGARKQGEKAPESDREVAAATKPALPAGDLPAAYGLLTKALETALGGSTDGTVRDSDVKRKMLHLNKGFDEGELGFTKFSRFLTKAAEDGVIDLQKKDSGNYMVGMGAGAVAAAPTPGEAESTGGKVEAAEKTAGDAGRSEAAGEEATARRLRPRVQRGRKGTEDEPPPLLEGQVAYVPGSSPQPGPEETEDEPSADSPETGGGRSGVRRSGRSGARKGGSGFDVESLGLPSDAKSILQYLSTQYKGVGAKTAEALVEAFGGDLFAELQDSPEKILKVVPGARGQKVLDAWTEDYDRRVAEKVQSGEAPVSASRPAETGGSRAGKKPGRRGTRRGRSRGS